MRRHQQLSYSYGYESDMRCVLSRYLEIVKSKVLSRERGQRQKRGGCEGGRYAEMGSRMLLWNQHICNREKTPLKVMIHIIAEFEGYLFIEIYKLGSVSFWTILYIFRMP
jgi:hypothetical protein